MPLNVFLNRLMCALVAGIVIGIERQLRKRDAGISVNALVSVGACIFILISESVITAAIESGGMVNNDNLRVLSQVVTGVGFLGAGVIMWRHAAIAVAAVVFINWIVKNIEIFIQKKNDDKN